MKKIFALFVAVLLTATLWAQSPEKMSYQAVIRNSSDALVTNTQVGMQISILQGSASGTAVYVETQTPTTNANGLVSLEIGTGTTSDDFSAIDWANGSYFIKTETDPTGGTSYTITGTSQLLSVPYALHAKTAETLSGEITETDPVYSGSEAANITATDITNLGNLSGVNTGDQDLSTLATKTALGDSTAQVRSEIPDVSGFLTSETDPVYSGSEAANITATDITNLGNLSGVNTGDQDFSTLATKTALGDSTAQVRSEIPDVSGFISSETDPLYGTSVASGITGADTSKWNTSFGWGNHADAGYDSNKDSWIGDSLTYSNSNIGIKTIPTQLNLQIGKIHDPFFTHSFSDIDTSMDRTLFVGGLWDSNTHSKGVLYLAGNWVDPDSVTGSINFVSGAWKNAAIQGREGTNTDWSGELVFLTRKDADPMTEKMRITQNGDVGIGTSNPTSKLTIAGMIESTSDGIKFPDGTIQATSTSASKHSVGDFAQGGIVFWVDETGQHGLVCAKEDQGAGVNWYAGTIGNTQAKGDGPFAGEANTAIIIAAQVAIGDDGSSYAARICNELQVTEGGKTYGDWYLPSKEELNLMYQNKAIIDATAGANGGSSFVSMSYWSSTEYDNYFAWGQTFDNDGGQIAGGKMYGGWVRAVRAF